MKRICLISFAIFCLSVASIESVRAQLWPTRPVRAVVSFPAGGIVDVLARLVLNQLSTQLQQPVVVENRTGAGTAIAAGLVAKADPDGYTVLVTSAAHTIVPALQPNLSYDPIRDFAAVMPLGTTANVLVVASDRKFKTVRDLVEHARAVPGSLNYASAGVGSGTHLSAERFRASAQLKAVHVPFKGTPEVITELLAGRVDFFVGPVGIVLPYIRDNKLVALAVNSPRRTATLPDVPTMSESGLVDAEYPNWFGMFLPVRTPRTILDRLQHETQSALQDRKVNEKLVALGVDPMVMSASEFDAHVKAEIAMNAALVKIAGITH
jgi:tripartite-type tricarboxylate transporter receptor subunit TctC